MAPSEHRVDVLTSPLAPAELEALGHLAAGARDPEVRAARCPEDVVCVVRGAGGAVLGASTAVPADVALVGGQRFGIYGSVLSPGAEEAADGLLSATFAALDAAHDGAPDEPIGLCVIIEDVAEMARRPEARWEDPPMYYVGYLDDGRQVRVGYFEGARIRELETRD